MASETYSPAHVTKDISGRITLPKQFSDRVPWMSGTVPIQAWLFLLQLGRYRLLSDTEVQDHPLLEPVRSVVLEGAPAARADPIFAEEFSRAGLIARLVPTTISPPKPGWRINIPKGLDIFLPPETDANALSVLISMEGYLEIWYTDVLRRAGTLPLTNR